MRQSPLRVFLSISLVLCCQGCASIVAPGPDRVPVSSTPPGATVTYDGKVQGKTPLDVVMPRRGPDTFTVSLDGYKPHAVKVKAVANGWAVGNIAFLILAPVTYVVDVIAGNELKWSTKPVVVTLESRPASSPAVAKTSP